MANAPQYIDQALSNVANAYINPTTSFIADALVPTVPVNKRTFLIPEIGYDLTIDSNTLRTGESEAKRVSNNRSYADGKPLLEHALKDFVTQDDKDQSDDPFEPMSLAVENIMQKFTLAQEADVATTLTDPSVVTNTRTLSGGSKWTSPTATPINDVLERLNTRTFVPFNTIAMSSAAYAAFATHPTVLETYKYAVGGTVTKEQVLDLFRPFGVEKILISDARRNTANQGQAPSYQLVWGADVVFSYVTSNPALKEINGAYKFQLNNGRFATQEDKKDPLGTEVVVHDYYRHQILMREAFANLKAVI